MSARIEICAYTPLVAVEALQAGADRVELCDDPRSEGTTPPEEWLSVMEPAIHRRLAVMVRPRGGDFCYSESELKQMEAYMLRQRDRYHLGAFVFGVLDAENRVDETACSRLLKAAGDVPCVFHRAIDLAADPETAIEILCRLGFVRVLCGLPLLQLLKLKGKAAGRLTVMPGGGIRSENAEDYLRAGFDELHSSARRNNPLRPDAEELKKLIALKHR